MKSNKQRRVEIMAARHARAEKRTQRYSRADDPRDLPIGGVPVDATALAPYNSYGVPDFVQRGYYLDRPFRCKDCGAEEVWSAERQKWWFEVAKGYAYSSATRCRECRAKERARKDAARRAAGHLPAG